MFFQRIVPTLPHEGHSSASVGLLGLTLLLGAVDCMTTVLFYPVAERFSDKCVTGLSSSIAVAFLFFCF